MWCSPRSNPPSTDRSIRGLESPENSCQSRDTISSLVGGLPSVEGGDRAQGPRYHRPVARDGGDSRPDRSRREPACSDARLRRDANLAHDRQLPTPGKRQRRLLRPDLDHLCRGRGRRWACRLCHRDEQQRLDLVRRNAPYRRHQPLHRLLPVCLGLLRRRRLRDHQVERWRVDVDRSGLDISGSVHLVFHDRRVHGRRWSRYCKDNRWRNMDSTDSPSRIELLWQVCRVQMSSLVLPLEFLTLILRLSEHRTDSLGHLLSQPLVNLLSAVIMRKLSTLRRRWNRKWWRRDNV